MPPALRSTLRNHCCFSTLQLAEKNMERAKQLLSTQKKEHAEASLALLDSALELCPGWEKALELKARTLLGLQKYRDVVEMLHEFVPSLIRPSSLPPSPSSPSLPVALPESPACKERIRLLSGYNPDSDEFLLLSPLSHCFSIAKLRERLASRFSHKKIEKRQQWRYLVLGQACWHLGMLEDAMVLLQSGKRTASLALRRQSNGMREDKFSVSEAPLSSRRHHLNEMATMDADMINQLLGNIKLLLRRRAAAMAALEAGLYAESVRHFSKVIDGRKGSSPQGFIADCYLHRAMAYQATGRVVDAIADCNRSLALKPHYAKALSIRASLFEMVRCFSECLLDLQQLKMIYEASLRYQMLPEPRAWSMRRQQYMADMDLAGGLDHINSKIMAARRRLISGCCSLDAHTVLDMPRNNCTSDGVKRAYLILSLKHRPDTAARLFDRCELLDDDRDMATVREEACASAHRLSQLIHKAYATVLSCMADEDMEAGKGQQGSESKPEDKDEADPLIIRLEKDHTFCSKQREAERICRYGEEGDDQKCSSSHGELDHVRHRSSHLFEVKSTEEESVSEEEDRDFCQPYGSLTTTALSDALSQALLHDLQSPSAAISAAAAAWPPNWSLASSQPLSVT